MGGANVVVMEPRTIHKPVMVAEVMAHLAVKPGGRYIDGTSGLGGHSEAIARGMGDDGRLQCIDRDAEALEFARAKLAPFGRRVSFAHGNFGDIGQLAAKHGFGGVDGILLDLGVSSLQLGAAERGFAFGLEGPLDMRMDPSAEGETAAEIVNQWDEASLAGLLREYGEEPRARRIAKAIIRARPLETTWELARAVEQVEGGARAPTHIHPATRVFLALRIRVNGELDHLDAGLPRARDLLGFGSPGGSGRLVVISFHSLEDRIEKRFLQQEAKDCICPPGLPLCRCGHRASLRLLTRRAVRASPDEVAANPRARSAVLRAAERIA